MRQTLSKHLKVLISGQSEMLLVAELFAVVIAIAIVASAIIQFIEPETFKSYFDAFWYTVVTITHTGYGDIVPKTTAGRWIGIALMLFSGFTMLTFMNVLSNLFLEKVSSRRQTAAKRREKELHSMVQDLRRQLEEKTADRAKMLALIEELAATARSSRAPTSGADCGQKS